MMLPLRKVWASLDFACGKRAAAGMEDILNALVRENKLSCDQRLIDNLRNMSGATIDRMLAPNRAKPAFKGRSNTKPGTLLKPQIQVRTGTDWDDARLRLS